VNSWRRWSGRLALGLYRGWARTCAKAFAVGAGGAFAAFGKKSVVALPVRLSGEGRIAVGNGVYIGAGSWLQVLDGEESGVALDIGDGTSIAGGVVLSAARSITLGRRVLIARNVYIADHTHAFADTGVAVMDQGIDRVEPVLIGDGAWLGENVVVGPGVTIGRGAVVGANSVVLTNVPERAVAVGAPARVVRAIGSAA
jgi:acetyltransferase-like isoleucine patch superfamily enzyme